MNTSSTLFTERLKRWIGTSSSQSRMTAGQVKSFSGKIAHAIPDHASFPVAKYWTEKGGEALKARMNQFMYRPALIADDEINDRLFTGIMGPLSQEGLAWPTEENDFDILLTRNYGRALNLRDDDSRACLLLCSPSEAERCNQAKISHFITKANWSSAASDHPSPKEQSELSWTLRRLIHEIRTQVLM